MKASKHQTTWLILISLLITIVSAGCTRIMPPTQEDFTESEQSALEALQSFATQTQLARTAEALPPTATPSPAVTSTGEVITPTGNPTWIPEPSPGEYPWNETPTEIKFKPGGTIAYFSRVIKAGDQHSYTLWAMGGQTMILSVFSENKGVYLELIGLSEGQTLLALTEETSSITITLPSTQEYQVTLYASQADTNYALSVEIPAVIDIVPGEKISLDGYIDVYKGYHPGVLTRVRYLISGKEGRTLKVKLESPQIDDLNLGLIGQSDGQAYWRHHVIGREGELEIPLTQGYYLDVYSTSGNSAPFTLQVEIK